MMEYVDKAGLPVKVSKATDVAAIKAAATLNLLPKRMRTKKESSYGRLRTEPLDSVSEEHDGAGLD